MSEVAATLKASGKGGGRTNDHEQTMVVSLAENQRGELRETPTAPALSRGGGKPGSGYSAVRDGTRIRRLTPTERERLMGAPDGWTYDFGPSLAGAELTFPAADRCPVDYPPDGPREAASGDGVVVQCAEWIGRRIAKTPSSSPADPSTARNSVVPYGAQRSGALSPNDER